MEIRDLVLIDGVRTPMAEFLGPFSDVSANELGARAARALFERTGLDPAIVDHAIVGNALQTSGDAIYGARHVALKAGVPKERPALTVNRLCGSGIQAILSGAHLILAGKAARPPPAWSAAWRTCRRRRSWCAARARGCASATASSRT
jgi:acetyl-CoA acetyltransferase